MEILPPESEPFAHPGPALGIADILSFDDLVDTQGVPLAFLAAPDVIRPSVHSDSREGSYMDGWMYKKFFEHYPDVQGVLKFFRTIYYPSKETLSLGELATLADTIVALPFYLVRRHALRATPPDAISPDVGHASRGIFGVSDLLHIMMNDLIDVYNEQSAVNGRMIYAYADKPIGSQQRSYLAPEKRRLSCVASADIIAEVVDMLIDKPHQEIDSPKSLVGILDKEEYEKLETFGVGFHHASAIVKRSKLCIRYCHTAYEAFLRSPSFEDVEKRGRVWLTAYKAFLNWEPHALKGLSFYQDLLNGALSRQELHAPVTFADVFPTLMHPSVQWNEFEQSS